jgi:hypothetical protein
MARPMVTELLLIAIPAVWLTLTTLVLSACRVAARADVSPGLADVSPGLADVSPGRADVSPGLADVSPGLGLAGDLEVVRCAHASLFLEDAPALHEVRSRLR